MIMISEIHSFVHGEISRTPLRGHSAQMAMVHSSSFFSRKDLIILSKDGTDVKILIPCPSRPGFER